MRVRPVVVKPVPDVENVCATLFLTLQLQQFDKFSLANGTKLSFEIRDKVEGILRAFDELNCI